ncbi:MAG: hypothetical protein ACRYGG_22520 [Janthinobacterium lividum]
MADSIKAQVTALRTQVSDIFSKHGKPLSYRESWQKIGIAPTIGRDAISDKVFSIKDAEELVSFAKANDIGLVSMWSMARDRPCEGDEGYDAAAFCSGTDASLFEYSLAFQELKGHWGSGLPTDQGQDARLTMQRLLGEKSAARSR